MPLLPVILSELGNLRRPENLFDQYFGDVLLRDDLLSPSYSAVAVPLLSTHYLRPWRVQHHKDSGVSHVSEKDGIKINLDVKQFKPEELSVKVIDGCVVVEGKHEERQDEHGYIQRQFTRRYRLPDNVNPDAVTSSLSSDGVLMVSAARKDVEPAKKRSIPIALTNAQAISGKEDKMEQ